MARRKLGASAAFAVTMLRSAWALTLVLTACTPLGSFEVGEPSSDDNVSDMPDFDIAPSLPDEAQLAWDTVTDDPADTQWTEAGELPQLWAFDDGTGLSTWKESCLDWKRIAVGSYLIVLRLVTE